MAHLLEIGRQPDEKPGADDADREQRRRERDAELVAAEQPEQRRAGFGAGRANAARAGRHLGAVKRGLLDAGAHPEQRDRRQRAQPEHDAPGELGRRQAEGDRVGEEDAGIADRPGALNGADDAPALRRVRVFRHQHRARGPLAAEPEALQRQEHQQLLVGLRAAGEQREQRVRRDREDQHPHAARARRPAPRRRRRPPRSSPGRRSRAAPPAREKAQTRRSRRAGQNPRSSGCRRRAPSRRRSPRTRRDRAGTASSTSPGARLAGRVRHSGAGCGPPGPLAPSGPPRDGPASIRLLQARMERSDHAGARIP